MNRRAWQAATVHPPTPVACAPHLRALHHAVTHSRSCEATTSTSWSAWLRRVTSHRHKRLGGQEAVKLPNVHPAARRLRCELCSTITAVVVVVLVVAVARPPPSAATVLVVVAIQHHRCWRRLVAGGHSGEANVQRVAVVQCFETMCFGSASLAPHGRVSATTFFPAGDWLCVPLSCLRGLPISPLWSLEKRFATSFAAARGRGRTQSVASACPVRRLPRAA